MGLINSHYILQYAFGIINWQSVIQSYNRIDDKTSGAKSVCQKCSQGEGEEWQALDKSVKDGAKRMQCLYLEGEIEQYSFEVDQYKEQVQEDRTITINPTKQIQFIVSYVRRDFTSDLYCLIVF